MAAGTSMLTLLGCSERCSQWAPLEAGRKHQPLWIHFPVSWQVTRGAWVPGGGLGEGGVGKPGRSTPSMAVCPQPAERCLLLSADPVLSQHSAVGVPITADPKGGAYTGLPDEYSVKG